MVDATVRVSIIADKKISDIILIEALLPKYSKKNFKADKKIEIIFYSQ